MPRLTRKGHKRRYAVLPGSPLYWWIRFNPNHPGWPAALLDAVDRILWDRRATGALEEFRERRAQCRA